MHALGLDFADLHQLLGFDDDIVGGGGHQRVEVVGRAQEHHVAEFIDDIGAEESDVSLQRLLKEVVLAIDVHNLLTVGHDGAKTCGGQHAAETCTVGADALCEGALRDVFHDEGAFVLLDGGLLVGAGVRHDSLLHLVVADQFAVGHFVVGRVVGNDSEVFNAFCNNSVNRKPPNMIVMPS